jgi:phage repressor protein C with HTH and peptisase S24 domain
MNTSWFYDSLARVGASQADLARHLRLAPSAVSRMLNGERQVKLLEAAQIAAFLGVPPEEVMRHAGEEASEPRPATPGRRGRPPGSRARAALATRPPDGASRGFASAPARADSIPIRSAARGGSDQEMFLGDGPIGYTPRPANLDGVRGAYAIYMVGDSMEPRYQQGWLLHVNPFKPPTRGRDVVVYKKDQAVLIKQFARWEGDDLVLQQLNPPDTLRVPRADISECHLVVGVDQEG